MGDVTISMERYEQLISLESRVNVAVDMITNKKYLSTEELLRIIGTEDALREASRLKEEDEKLAKEMNEKYGFAVTANADV